ncbi:hypothetical protein [Mycobacterium sp. Root135]|uniref:hypothetical protein n=1 Tax=Mycobacterium sp. Root135 TaxID=1736457 RepID=UPI000ADB097D|nr:hypothetical protein [Mycobacterium sp. Root135]
MGYTAQILDDVRKQLAPEDLVLKEARNRREAVKTAASSFRGVLRAYNSGSLAHGTANCPIHHRDKGLDADCGIVLDRRSHFAFGPDSTSHVGPSGIVARVLEHVTPQIVDEYPQAQLSVTKRAIFVEINQPFSSGEDPTVDLIVGLERQANGLWIPNTEEHRWDPAHPEKHTQLLTGEPKSLRVTRARAIRLAKAENKRSTPPLCSFNIEALALMFVDSGDSEPQALMSLWRRGSRDLALRLTPDPAGVSAPIKVADREYAVARLSFAADRLQAALDNDQTESIVRSNLQQLWPDFVAATATESTKARTAARLKSGKPLGVNAFGALTTVGGASLKSPRSFGD